MTILSELFSSASGQQSSIGYATGAISLRQLRGGNMGLIKGFLASG